jgi:tetratricopeptide (TPR) repeat protein
MEPQPVDPAISREEIVDDAYAGIGALVAVGDAEEAIAAYEKAQLENPDDPKTRVLLSNLYLFAGRLDEAKAILDGILEIEPNRPDALLARAQIAGAQGEQDLRLDLLQRLVEAHPTHAEGHAALGEAYLEERRFDEARESFEASLSTDEDNFVALIGLGNLHLRQDRPERAERALTQAIKISPEYAFAYADRGKARAVQQNLQGAEADMDVAIDLEPSYSWNYFDRGRVRLERARFAEAIDDFTIAIELDPSVFMSYVYRARAFAGLKQTAPAIQDYETALSMRPDYEPAYAPLGVLYVISDQPRRAARKFQQAYDYESRAVWYALLAALSLKEAGSEQEAERYLERVSPEFPRDSLYYETAKFLLRPNYDGRVRELILKEENDVLRSQLLFYLGWQYELNGNPSSARAAYLETLDADASGLAEQRLAEVRLENLSGGDSR